MSTNLKEQTAKSLIWSAIDKGGYQFITLVVGIITARLLSPKDFGFLGALAIFTLLSNIFIESGFTVALIRRKENTSEEYSTVLFFNLLIATLIYLTLYFVAPYIASFYEMPELLKLSRFLFLVIIINSVGIIQNVVLLKELAFKQIMIANLSSVIISGIVTIWLVLEGFEYWALAWQQISMYSIRVLILWAFSPLKISLKVNTSIIKEIFGFSSILLLINFINTIVKNIYNVIIGKLFNAHYLGYYTQANKLQFLPSNIISVMFSSVANPVFSKLNDEKERQLNYFRKLIRLTSFVIFPLMTGLIVTSNELIEILLTEKWLPITPYFKILAVSGIIWPFHLLNQNLIKIRGKAKLSLKLELIRNGLIIASLSLLFRDITMMLIGFVIANIISYIIQLFVAKKEFGYNILWHLKDIVPYAAISGAMMVILVFVQKIPTTTFLSLTLQVIIGGVFYITMVKVLGSKIFEEFISFIKRGKF